MRGEPRVLGHRPTLADRPDRRVEEVRIEKLTPAQLRALERPTALDPRVRPVERFIERWNASYYQTPDVPRLGYARVREPAAPRSSATPLGPDEFVAVDYAIFHSEGWARRFVYARYRMGRTIREIAEEEGRKPRAIHEEQVRVLFYYLGLFQGEGFKLPAIWEPET